MEPTTSNPIGIYGWRKRCLYCFIGLLTILILVNISLTVWILVVLRFNIDGMGSVRVTDEGLQVNGEAEFLGKLYTDIISGDEDGPLRVQAAREVSLTVRDSKFEVDASNVKVKSSGFSVHSNKGQELLSISSNMSTTSIRSDTVMVSGEVAIDKSLHSSQVYSRDTLVLSSDRNGVRVYGNESVLVESRSSSVDIQAGGRGGGGNITLTANEGMVEIGSGTVLMKSLPLSVPMDSGKAWNGTYHLCICSNGLLYRVRTAQNTSCANYSSICN